MDSVIKNKLSYCKQSPLMKAPLMKGGDMLKEFHSFCEKQ